MKTVKAALPVFVGVLAALLAYAWLYHHISFFR